MDLHDYLRTKTKDELIGIMFSALDLMQHYNGREVRWCVVNAIPGSVTKERVGGGYTYQVPVVTKTMVEL